MPAFILRTLLLVIVALAPTVATAQVRVLARVNDDAITDFEGMIEL